MSAVLKQSISALLWCSGNTFVMFHKKLQVLTVLGTVRLSWVMLKGAAESSYSMERHSAADSTTNAAESQQ